VGGHFVIGLPSETIQSAKDSIAFMKELKLDVAGFNQLVPLPGSRLWDWIGTNGQFLNEPEKIYEQLRHDNPEPQFETVDFSAEERRIVYDEAVKEVDRMIRHRMLSPKNIWRFLLGIHSFQDVKWGIQRLLNVFLKRDLRRKYTPRPSSDIEA